MQVLCSYGAGNPRPCVVWTSVVSLPWFERAPSRWNSSLCKRKLIWIGAIIKSICRCQISFRKTGRLWEEWEKHCPMQNEVLFSSHACGGVRQEWWGHGAEVGTAEPGWGPAEIPAAMLRQSRQQVRVFQACGLSLTKADTEASTAFLARNAPTLGWRKDWGAGEAGSASRVLSAEGGLFFKEPLFYGVDLFASALNSLSA